MALPGHLLEKNESELEDWFLTSSEAPELPVDDLLAVIEDLSSSGNVQRCEDWSEMLQENLVEQGNRLAVIRLLRMRTQWRDDNADLRNLCEKTTTPLFLDRLGKAYLESVSFEGKMKTHEVLRRLEVLAQLAEGKLCHEKTWGFGVIRRVDDFYKKVTVDFVKKSGHEMSFAYAGETLEIISDEHILAMRHRAPDALAEMIKGEPDDVIRITLRSYGPMSVPDLQDFLTEEILGDAEWKSFWDRARKGLKSDPLIEIPTKRNEPVRILTSVKSYGTDWLKTLAQEKDVPAILKLIDELVTAVKTMDEEQESAVARRLNFSVRAAEGKYPGQLVRVMLTAERLGLSEGAEPVPVETIEHSLLEPSTLLKACNGLPVRDVHAFFIHMTARHRQALTDSLQQILFLLPKHVLNEAVEVIQGSEQEPAVWDSIRETLFRRELEAPMLLYLTEHMQFLEAWSLGNTGDVMNNMLMILDKRADDSDSVKHRKLLSAVFDDPAWLQSMLTPMDDRNRRDCMRRVRECRGWDESTRRSAMGKMIKLFPDLQAEAAPKSEEGTHRGRFTSWRSYQERQEQLRVLIEVTIPANSKDIGHARSYGDLRENFEYQTAKDQQGLLMRRKADWERDLAEVRGTDFRGAPAKKVGMGTGVKLSRPDGREDGYWILGEWDRDETLNIISNMSEIAQRLEGAGPNDEVRMPDDGESEKTRIIAVSALSDELAAWVTGKGA